MNESAGKWARLGRLSGWQWRVLLGTPVLLLLTRHRLGRLGYRETLRRASPDADSGRPPSEQMQDARDAAYAVAAAVKYGPWRPRCLLRSLTLGWFLGRRGIPFEIRIGLPEGARPASLDFDAHAWVEHAGEVLNDREDVAQQYRVFRENHQK